MLYYGGGELDAIINQIKEDVIADIGGDRFIISQREKNNTTTIRYGITHEKAKGVMLQITKEHYIKSEYNIHPKYKHEVLHIFGIVVCLSEIGEEEKEVTLYIKVNILNAPRKTIAVSFHEAEWPLL